MGACTRQCTYGILWQNAGITIALANGNVVCCAVPVKSQLRLPGKVAHVINAVLLEAPHKVARMHIRDDECVDLQKAIKQMRVADDKISCQAQCHHTVESGSTTCAKRRSQADCGAYGHAFSQCLLISKHARRVRRASDLAAGVLIKWRADKRCQVRQLCIELHAVLLHVHTNRMLVHMHFARNMHPWPVCHTCDMHTFRGAATSTCLKTGSQTSAWHL